jgi:plastocyanin domain-containing protein
VVLAVEAEGAASGVIDVMVEGGVYAPARIEVSAGQPVTLRFLRKDPSPCAEKVLFDDLGIAADLPIDQPNETSAGSFRPGPMPGVLSLGLRLYPHRHAGP